MKRAYCKLGLCAERLVLLDLCSLGGYRGLICGDF